MPGEPGPPPSELEKLAGYSSDIAARGRGARLLRELASTRLTFTLRIGDPAAVRAVGIWLIEQWRKLGIIVKQEGRRGLGMVSVYGGATRGGMDAQCSCVVGPTSTGKVPVRWDSDIKYGRYKEAVLDDLSSSRREPGPRRA